MDCTHKSYNRFHPIWFTWNCVANEANFASEKNMRKILQIVSTTMKQIKRIAKPNCINVNRCMGFSTLEPYIVRGALCASDLLKIFQSKSTRFSHQTQNENRYFCHFARHLCRKFHFAAKRAGGMLIVQYYCNQRLFYISASFLVLRILWKNQPKRLLAVS